MPVRPHNSVANNQLMIGYSYCSGIWSPIIRHSVPFGPSSTNRVDFSNRGNSLLQKAFLVPEPQGYISYWGLLETLYVTYPPQMPLTIGSAGLYCSSSRATCAATRTQSKEVSYFGPNLHMETF